MYTLGMARKARPMSHLETRHRGFQQRVMAMKTPPVSAQVPSSISRQTARPAAPRTVLGSTNATSPTDDDAFAPRQGATTRKTSSAKSNARMTVFNDDDAEGSTPISHNAWPDVGTKKARVKENIREVTKAGAGVPLRGGKKSASASAKIIPFEDTEENTTEEPERCIDALQQVACKTPAKSFIVPFCDDENEEGAVLPTPNKRDVEVNLLCSKRSREHSEAEALKRDPFKNYSNLELHDDR